MSTEVKVPSVGESITSGVIVTWLKHTGDRVEQGENLFELETDKAVLEVPSPEAGTLETLVDEGTEVAIGQTVATLDAEAGMESHSAPAKEEAVQTEEQKPKGAAAAPAEAKPTEPAPSEPAPAPSQSGASAAAQSPAAAPTKAPPQKAPAASVTTPTAPKRPAGDEQRTERVPMTMIRKRTAERLVRAKQTAAHLTTFNEIDMHAVMDIRSRRKDAFEKEHGTRLGFMSFFVKACCQALKEFPAVNTQVDGDDILYHHFYNIGVAISIESGLIVPVIRSADTLHFADIEAAITDLARRAKEKRVQPDELTGGTFSITNGGVFGSLLSTPIPAFPQTAILGMHAIRKRPVVVDDQIVVRPMMYVALTYDHRVIDGREAIGFLARVRDYIEEPDKLLLEL